MYDFFYNMKELRERIMKIYSFLITLDMNP